MIDRTDPDALVPRVPAEALPGPDPGAAPIDLSKLAEVVAPLMRQPYEQNIQDVRERAKARLDLRRLELEHEVSVANADGAARVAESEASAEVRTSDINRRFCLAIALGLGFLAIGVVLIAHGEISNSAFLLMGSMGIVTAIVNRTPAHPTPKSPGGP